MIVMGMDCLVDVPHLDIYGEFFLDFSFQALFRCFSVFQLAAWELPLACQRSFPALAEQDVIAPPDNGCYHR